jgi:hypothetical protein
MVAAFEKVSGKVTNKLYALKIMQCMCCCWCLLDNYIYG